VLGGLTGVINRRADWSNCTFSTKDHKEYNRFLLSPERGDFG
jgi:hypothetical protein